MNQIKVVIVDDSAFIRKALTMMLESDPQIKVVATARDGLQGIEKIREFRPNIVTLDLEMPGMDGLTALKTIMKEMPLPVLVVSSLTAEGSQATLDALKLGAVDFIPKELSYVSLDIVKIKQELVAKVKQIAESGIRTLPKPNPEVIANLRLPHKEFQAVVLGVSTGGPFALMQMIPQFPSDFPLGLIVVQHMPPHFTKTMAARINELSKLRVKEAEDGDKAEPGTVLIAPGGQHLTLQKNGKGVTAKVSIEPMDTMYRPSVDITMESAAQNFEKSVIGVIMTGMGRDGVQGLKKIKERRGYVIAQDEASCVVYGMPKAAVESGLADIILPLDAIPDALQQLSRSL